MRPWEALSYVLWARMPQKTEDPTRPNHGRPCQDSFYGCLNVRGRGLLILHKANQLGPRGINRKRIFHVSNYYSFNCETNGALAEHLKSRWTASKTCMVKPRVRIQMTLLVGLVDCPDWPMNRVLKFTTSNPAPNLQSR